MIADIEERHKGLPRLQQLSHILLVLFVGLVALLLWISYSPESNYRDIGNIVSINRLAMNEGSVTNKEKQEIESASASQDIKLESIFNIPIAPSVSTLKSLPSTAAIKKPKPKPRIKRAKSLAKKVPKRFDKKILPVTPQDQAEKLYRSGLALLSNSQKKSAVEKFIAALNLDGDHFLSQRALASVYINQKNWVNAEEVLTEALARQKNITVLSILLSRVYLEQGKYVLAIRVLKQNPEYQKGLVDGQYYSLLAFALQSEKRYQEAIAAYEGAIKTDVYNSNWWLGLAVSLEMIENWRDAKKAYSRALETSNLNNELIPYTKDRYEYVANQIAQLENSNAESP